MEADIEGKCKHKQEIMFELNESEVVDFEADRGLKYLCQMRNYTFDQRGMLYRRPS